jgi:hypothetical protein
MSADFSFLKGLQVTPETTAEYRFSNILLANGKNPVFIVRPATESNKPYFNAVLRRSGKNAKALSAGQLDSEMIDEGRRDDRELFPKYIVTGWRDVVDSSGELVPFSKEECASFLQQLPDEEFSDLKQYCGNVRNFVKPIDVGDLAKN